MGGSLVLVASTLAVLVFLGLFLGYALITLRRKIKRRDEAKQYEGGESAVHLDKDGSISGDTVSTLEGPVVVIVDPAQERRGPADFPPGHLTSTFSTRNKDGGESGSYLVFSSFNRTESVQTIEGFLSHHAGGLGSHDMRKIDGFERGGGPSSMQSSNTVVTQSRGASRAGRGAYDPAQPILPMDVFESDEVQTVILGSTTDHDDDFSHPVHIHHHPHHQLIMKSSKMCRSMSYPTPSLFMGASCRNGIPWGRIWKELYWLNNQRDYASNLNSSVKWGRAVSLIPKASKIPRPKSKNFKIGIWAEGIGEQISIAAPPVSRLPGPPPCRQVDS